MTQTSLPVIQIRLFGTCSITFRDHTLRATDCHSKKLWVLFAYMVLYRNREILQEEFTELLWDQRKNNNPSSALKALMHRLRKLLDSLDYPEPIIIPHHGSYAINPVIPCQIDMENFLALCKESDGLKGTPGYENKLKQALELYKGDFMPENRENLWVASLSAQYHALYLHSAQALIEHLIQIEAYAQAANLCWQALTFSPYEESIHYCLIHSLYLSGSQKAAITQYNSSRDLFLSRFSQLPSKRFDALYKIITTSQNSIETDIELIQDSLIEHRPKGTFFCEYEIFKELYRLETRIVKRTQTSIYLCLITITAAASGKYALSQSMQQLKDAILDSLRGCDIFSRYSSSQYLLLIPAPDQEAMKQILERVVSQYRSKNTSDTIEYAIRRLEGIS